MVRLKRSDTTLNLIEFGPALMDFLRAAKLVNGKVVFVEPDEKSLMRLEKNQTELVEKKKRQHMKLYSKSNSPELSQQILKMKLKNSLLFPAKVTFLRCFVLNALAYLFRSTVYETWTLVNTQLMFFNLPLKLLREVSYLVNSQLNLRTLSESYPVFTCICKRNAFLLKKDALG